MNGFTDADVPNQSGKCFIVTGANSGIGFEVSLVLAAREARVFLACRDKTKAEAAISRIRQIHPHADVVFLPLDLADLTSIRTAAEIVAKEQKIDVLINNAGVMYPPLTRTRQGFELQFGVNHLGCFALTSLLLGKLRETGGARVVITSSLAHRGGKFDWDDLNAERKYNRFQSYAASKLANALFLFELDRRLRFAGSDIAAVGCHPGFAATELARYMGAFKVLIPLAKLVINSAAEGAWPTLQAATGQVVPGGYYGPGGFREIRGASRKSTRSAKSQDPKLSQRLWDVSVSMTGIDPGLSSAI